MPTVHVSLWVGQTVSVSGADMAGEQVEYALDDWAVESRQMLRQLLVGAAVPHVWEGGRLVVPEAFEATADDLVDEVATTFAGTLDDPAVPRVAFDVADFDPGLVDELVTALDDAGVEWLLDTAGDLVVAEGDAEAVDAAVERLEFPHALPLADPDSTATAAAMAVSVDSDLAGVSAAVGNGSDGAGDGAGANAATSVAEIDPDRVLGGLFVAADRLARSATDPSGVLDAINLGGELAAGAAPFGFDAAVWDRITGASAVLVSRIEDADSGDEQIEESAAELRDLLRHWV